MTFASAISRTFVYSSISRRKLYEEQRARAEAEHRKYLEMSGKVAAKPTYKLMGSRKNVKKSDSGMD